MPDDRPELKLEGHSVSGTIKISVGEQGQPTVRATLEIPLFGPLRTAFSNHIKKNDPTPYLTFEGVVFDGPTNALVKFRVRGKVTNTRFPNTSRAIFQSLGEPELWEVKPLQ